MSVEIRGITPLLQVFDMPASIRFYRDVLGFEVVNTSPIVQGKQGDYFHWAMLRLNGIQLMLNTAYDKGERPKTPNAARVAAHGDIGLFIECPEIDRVWGELRATGVRVAEEPAVTRYGMKRFGIIDPDGYHLYFQWPV